MLTTIMMIECAPEHAEDIAEAACHVPGVCESYVTASATCRVLAVVRVPDDTMLAGTENHIAAIGGVKKILPVEVISARAADELVRIRTDYE